MSFSSMQQLMHGDPISTALVVGRKSTHCEKIWPVDVLFPEKLEGNADIASVDEGYAMMLEGMVRAIKPSVVFETGTHKGRSARAIALGLQYNQQGVLYTVDMDDYGLMKSGALDGGLDQHVIQIVGRTPRIFECAELKKLQGIDFAHIDGDHTREGLIADIKYVEEHCVDGCVVIVDNSIDPMWGDVREVLDESKYKTVKLPTMCGSDIFVINK